MNHARAGRPAPDDAGIGLVEVLVALLVVSVVMTAFGQFLYQSLRTQRADNLQASANALGVAELEAMQALPWSLLGHYTTDGATGADLVILGATRPAGSRVPLALSTGVELGRGTYTVNRTVRWVLDPATSNPTDYKRLEVRVEWTGPNGPRSVKVHSLRTPQAGELAPSDFAIRSALPNPLDIGLTGTGATTSALSLTATVTSPGSAATAKWTGRDGTTVTQPLTSSDGGKTWSAVLPSGTCCFANRLLPFVFSVSRTSPQSTISSTQTASLLEDLAVASVTADPPAQCVNGSELSPITVAITTRGTVLGDPVVVTASTGGSWTATHVGETPSGNTWTATVPAAALASGTTFTATASRVRPSPGEASATSAVAGVTC